jgi:hypothetical protein
MNQEMNMRDYPTAPVRKGRSRIRALVHFLALVHLSFAALLMSACFGMQARAVTAPESLDMPEPPPRVVEVHDPEVPPPIPLPEEPIRNTPPRLRPAPATEAPRTAEPPKSEPAADVVKPAEEPARAGSNLQTTPVQQEGEVERRIRTALAQAMTDLNRINYQALSADARTQYDIAKRFVSQAEEALRAKNLVYATNLADKAASMAVQLAGR